MKPIWIILGMMAVTYVPRLLPGLLLQRNQMPPTFEKWLKNIPYAALGALIFPGIIEGETPLVGVIGGLTAVVLSLLNVHIVLVMMGTVLVAIIAQYVL
jgi:branched-subunit amino acid transport protein